MESNELVNELSKNFIEYAAAVNGDRAIPDATSGLKPVARRILWGAFDGGYISSKEYAKCARIVGDVMGKWHPHGDSSIYGALVRLSQPWIMRYPLIDFHGNMGSIAGDGPAAYRYTNARLSKLSEEGMLNNIKKKNVEFIANYDENDFEPITLPSIFPNLLCNPNSGIGVAMACNWLPHNLNEVAECIEQYIDGKEYSLPGPDFPTGGIIINKNDIPNIMATGHGSVKVRGRYKIEKNKNIVFYEIPYGTSIESLITEIGKICEDKEIEGIEDIRDESGKKGLRIVIECEKNINPETLIPKLFAKTNLQTSISYNQVALVNKTPTELNLEQCLQIYVKHNTECICREVQFDLEKAGDRVHILNGLLKALENIDNIITLIKKSENVAAAKDKLIEKYQFTEAQAKAILAMRLSSLASLEKIELQNEKAELDKKMDKLNALLANEDLQKIEIKNRLNTLVKKYGDDRRTELTQIEVSNEDKEIATITPEDVIVVMSKNGEIKKIPKASFKVQKRNTKGVKAEGDVILATLSTNTIDNLLLFTDKGQMYRTLVDNIPNGTNTSKGGRITDLINLQPSEKVIAMTSLERKNDKKYVVFITKKGLIKKTLLEEYTKTKRNTGIQAIKIKDGDSIANIEIMNEEDMLITTKNGQAIHFETKNIAAIGRVTCGVKAITLKNNDEVLNGIVVKDNDEIAFFSEGGYGKKVNLNEFPKQNRGGMGVTTLKEGNLIGATVIKNNDNLLLIGNTSICIAATEVPLLSRIAIGNIMIKTKNLKSIVKI